MTGPEGNVLVGLVYCSKALKPRRAAPDELVSSVFRLIVLRDATGAILPDDLGAPLIRASFFGKLYYINCHLFSP